MSSLFQNFETLDDTTLVSLIKDAKVKTFTLLPDDSDQKPEVFTLKPDHNLKCLSDNNENTIPYVFLDTDNQEATLCQECLEMSVYSPEGYSDILYTL